MHIEPYRGGSFTLSDWNTVSTGLDRYAAVLTWDNGEDKFSSCLYAYHQDIKLTSMHKSVPEDVAETIVKNEAISQGVRFLKDYVERSKS